MNKIVASVGAAIAAVMVSAIVQAAPVQLAEGDAEGEHSFDTAGHWENTTAPEPGSDYLVALGTDAPLRTPIVNITTAASEAFYDFAGDSLTIGTADTPGAFYDFFYRYARLRIPELHLVNGAFWTGTDQSYHQAQNEQALYGTIYVDSTTNNPFAFKSLKNGGGLSLRGPLVGDEDSAICVKGGVGTTYLALCAPSPDFKGRIIVEQNGYIWPGQQALAANAFGSTPETFMKDAIILRNGGGIGSSDSTVWDLKAENRGIWVEGSGGFSSQGSYKISMPIGGGQLPEGKYLQIQPHVYAVITVNAPVSAYPIKLNNGRVLFTENATIEGETPILMTGNNCLGTTVDRSFKVDFQGTGFYYEAPMNATSVPVITLEEGSLWAESRNSCVIRLSSDSFPMVNTDGWIPVLKVPTSVKDLSTVTFTAQNSGGTEIPSAQFKVETDEDGLQTVSVMPPTYYVVHPSTPGHEAVAPYTSWETAATNIADAVAEAADNGMGGRIYVDRGTYDITEPIPFGCCWRTSSGSGWQQRPVSLVGVNRETMERDAEHVILDGGYPARTNMLFTFGSARPKSAAGIEYSGSTGCSLISLTMQHACNMENNSEWKNGGVGSLYCANVDFVVTGCRFLENHAVRGGVFQASGQMITNCYFKGNTSSDGPTCLHNPQGAASVDGNYLRVLDCVFEDNTVGNSGQLYNGRSARFIGCTFRRCGRNGGGLFAFNYYSVVQNCLFEDNYGSVSLGGCSGDSPLVWSDLVVRNSDVGTSSALSLPNNLAERVTVVGCTCKYAISGNTSKIRNFLVISNTCSDAAIYSQDGTAGNAYYWESGTIVANTAANWAIQIAANGQQENVTNIVRNCVVWGNRKASGTAAPIRLAPKSKVISFTHCDLETPIEAAYDDGTCFSENPKFFNLYRTGDVRLRQDSPLIGAGLLQDWMEDAVDLAGNPRLVGEAPDIGCYERQGTEIDPPYLCTRAVAKEEDKTGVWADAFVGIQPAVDAAYDEEPLYVKAGTYALTEPVTVKNRTIAFVGEGADKTILDGQGASRCLVAILQSGAAGDLTFEGFTFTNGCAGTDTSADNYYARGGCVYLSCADTTRRVELSDCRVTGGRSLQPLTNGNVPNGSYFRGAGAYVEKYCTVTGCVFDDNIASNTYASAVGMESAGTAGVRGSGTVFSDCIISNCQNLGKSGGGGSMCSGIYNWGSGLWLEGTTFAQLTGDKTTDEKYYGAINTGNGATVTNCVFRDCKAAYYLLNAGTSVQVSDCLFERCNSCGVVHSNPSFERCVFRGNSGHIWFNTMPLVVRNCLFTDNAANINWVYNGDNLRGTYENCTFVDNKAAVIQMQNGRVNEQYAFVNCVLFGNKYDVNATWNDSNLTVYTNCFVEAYTTKTPETHEGCIVGKNPRFVDRANGNYRPKSNSPLRDAALTLDWMTEEAIDLEGNPRRLAKDGKPYPDALPDIGCYECAIPAPGLLLFVR